MCGRIVLPGESETESIGGESKFSSFNDLPITEVMVRFPGFGTDPSEWVVGPFAPTTALKFFQQPLLIGSSFDQSTLNPNYFSQIQASAATVQRFGSDIVSTDASGIPRARLGYYSYHPTRGFTLGGVGLGGVDGAADASAGDFAQSIIALGSVSMIATTKKSSPSALLRLLGDVEVLTRCCRLVMF